jgi:hypothetical protein
MFSLKNKVWVINSKKIDGRYNKGIVVGIEMIYDGLGFMSERQYFNDFEEYRYKVAYVDVFTNKGCCEWLHHEYLSKTKPIDS